MKKITFIGLVLWVLSSVACEKPQEKTEFGVTNFSHSECKGDNQKSTNKECIEYKIKDGNHLNINHLNIIFNCCPGELTVNTSISKDTITVYENELEQGCKCLCNYDLNYVVGPLNFSKYIVIVNKKNKKHAEFVLDFNANTNGTFVISSKQ